MSLREQIKDSFIGGLIPGSLAYQITHAAIQSNKEYDEYKAQYASDGKGRTDYATNIDDVAVGASLGLCGAIIDASTYLLYESALSNIIGHDLFSYNTDFIGNLESPLALASGVFCLRAGTYLLTKAIHQPSNKSPSSVK